MTNSLLYARHSRVHEKFPPENSTIGELGTLWDLLSSGETVSFGENVAKHFLLGQQWVIDFKAEEPH